MPKKTKTTAASEYRREKARRRLGQHTKCTMCEESRPEALIPGSTPRVCAECQRKHDGKSPIDLHHLAGRNNHPGTIPIPANDHRAVLSADQYEWPERTLRNPDASPLLAAGGCIRGFIDFIELCIERFIEWAAYKLEEVDAYLVEKYGPDWWRFLAQQKTGEAQ
jgi:hypothetical protein